MKNTIRCAGDADLAVSGALPKHDRSFRVAARLHPFSHDRVTDTMQEGITMAGIVERMIPTERRPFAHAYVNNILIPAAVWHQLKPKAGSYVSIKIVPQGGGGGKSPVAMVLSVALAFAAPALGAALATSTGLATATAGGLISWNVMGFSGVSLMTGLVSAVGRLAISAIAPPATQKNNVGTPDPAESPTQFISGAQNRALPFGRVPTPLGKCRMVPPLGAQPYTEVVGGNQYLRMLFVWGNGPLDISDLKIGDTDLSEYKNVEIEHRYGYPDDEPLTLFSNDVGQNQLSVVLREADSWQLRTSEDEVDEISVDLTFGGGLTRFNSSGNKVDRTVDLAIEYALTGTDDWTDLDGYKVVSAQTSPVIRRPASSQGNVTEAVWRISVDKVSGKMKAEVGPTFIYGVTEGTPLAPAVPDGFWPVARINRRSDDAADNLIDAGSITDDRDPDLFGDIFNTAGDFEVTPSLTANKVSVASGGIKQAQLQITGRQTSALIYSQRWTVPRGQYDVRIRRVTLDSDDEKILDTVTWSCLRSIRNRPPVKATGVAMTALRIKATDQLNGVIDRFNGVVHSITPDWDGAAWVERATSNPAALYRRVLQGKENARALPDTRINLPALQDWAVDCTSAGREFNLVIDYDTSIHDLLQIIAAAGRASPTMVDGKWRVVQDKLQTVPVQMFTPRNVRGFQVQKIFPELPHAFRVQFKNRYKDWQDDEIIVYDDGYDENTATLYETLQLTGVTDPDQAWKDGRYHIATARLRAETYQFTTDFEHIICTRGDLVAVAHDVILVSNGSGRIVELTDNGTHVTALRIDENFEFISGKTYVARVRYADGGQELYNLTTIGGTTSTLMLQTPILLADAPGLGDLVTVGETGKEVINCLVRSIEPSSNMTARITALPAAPAVYSADTGVIPTHDPQITLPVDLRRPPAPDIATIQSGSELLIQSGEASFVNAIVIRLNPHGFPRQLTPVVSIRTVGETLYRPADAIITDNKITITDIELSALYDIRIYYRSATGGLNSAETVIAGYDVQGGILPPPDVTNFKVNVLGETAYMSWDPITDIFLSHYRIRFAADIDTASWESAVDLIERVGKPSTSTTSPAQVGAYLIKAVSTTGIESVNTALVTSNIALLDGVNAVEVINESDTFGGTLTDLILFVGGLQLDGAGEITIGYYDFENVLDLGEVYTSKVSASTQATNINISNNFDLFANIDLVANIDGTSGSTGWDVRLQISTTQDDPTGTPTWSDWSNLVVGNYTARAFRFRLVLRSLEFGISPYVYDCKVTVDMPDRIVAMNNVVSDETDAPKTTVTFDGGAFKAVPAITITAQNGATGDYHLITDQNTAGFDIAFYNTSGTRITRTFDYVAKGWGRQIPPA